MTAHSLKLHSAFPNVSAGQTVADGDLQVCKKYLPTETEFVDRAQEIAAKIIARESRGHGDVDAAMHRIDAEYDIDYQTLWKLKYRKPKTIAVGAYMRLMTIYEAVCKQQAILLAEDLEHARTLKDAAYATPVRAAEAVLVDEKTCARVD